jgi:hypothetical protein
MFSQNELRAMFIYDEQNGDLRWRNHYSNPSKNGNLVGSKNTDGYLCVRIKGKMYRIHRLIWSYMYGEIPDAKQIDHIDHVRSNNALSNLRMVSEIDNHRNQKHRVTNTSGAMGVSFDKSTNKWVANITINGRYKNLGRFSSIDEAIKRRQEEVIRNGFHKNHGVNSMC